MTSQAGVPVRRGKLLTGLAIFFSLAAGVDLLKAFSAPAPDLRGRTAPFGIVVLGIRHAGPEKTVLGVLFAAFLLFYATGIWRMRRYAMVAAWIYALYMMVNVPLYVVRNPAPPTPGGMIFAIVYLILAVVITAGSAVALTRRRPELG